ncbi:hypothetical protein [Alienimonas californiensis]|uniref:hypothetical protein n=1 Tax=Alienimonas californiensis TaxID=2527989 RepID=UPI0011A46E35|nr:hypothetical protein [Alienimonas californiensis]
MPDAPAPAAPTPKPSVPKAAAPRTPEQLHAYVHETLCARENLLSNQFRTVAAPLTRAGKPCGCQYTLLGPRSVRLTAVWDAVRNCLFLFDATGARIEKRMLPQRIRLAS